MLCGALPRRVYLIHLDGLAEPWARNSDDFKHPDLLDWVRGERPRLLAAGYTLYQYWLAKGSPRAAHKREMTSFETWSRVIGGVLDAVGVSAFLETAQAQMATIDPSRREWMEFIMALAVAYPNEQSFRAVDIFTQHLQTGHLSGDRVADTLPEEVQGFLGNMDNLDQYHASGRFNQALGRALMARRGRVIASFRLEVASENTHHGNRFKLVAVEKGGRR